MKNISWFKENIIPYLEGFEIEFKFYENGDFGDLNQVEFNSNEKGGEIDFWSTGWLGIHLVDYIEGEEILNVLLGPDQYEEKENAGKRLQELLQH
jgi:hypothetical protein